MRRVKFKEAVLLMLPVVAMMCVALWWQQKDKRNAVLETGPLRLEVEKIERVAPTPAQVAEGFDTKFLVTFAYRGKSSSSLFRNATEASKSVSVRKISLLERDEKNWRPVLSDVFPSIRAEGYWESREVGKMQAALLVPLGKLPDKDLQLRLSLNGSSISPSTPILSPTLSIPLRKAGEAAPNPQVSRECSLSLQSAKVNLFKPVSHYRIGGKPGAYRTVEFEVKTQSSWRRNPDSKWKMFNAHIVDENGKIYRKWLGWEMYSPVPRARFANFTRSPTNPTKKPNVYKFEYFFSTAFIPASAGRLTFKAQVSENGEWPLPLSVVVREKDDWTLKRSRSLKLKSIEIQQSTDDPSRLDVIVKINHAGEQKFVARTQDGLFFYSYGDMYQMDGVVPEHYQLERKSNSRLLVTDWSQRIESSLSPIPSSALEKANSGYYPVRLKSISSTEKEWEIIYRITSLRLKRVPPPLVFKADIGVEGDRFLPVSVPLPPALVAKTAATPLP